MRFKDGQFFTVDKLSPHMEKTPEGFLLCRDVPISRVGTFDYSEQEAYIKGGPRGIVKMRRTEDELFNPDTVRSFEGKDVVIGHSSFVDPDNWRRRSIGTVQNVRRGEGENADKLMADLLIKDAKGIDLVESGRLREVSCGYDARPVADGIGEGHQEGIVGNHVALVEKGRCGDACKVRDGDMTTSLKTVLRRLFKDGDEDRFNEALDGMNVTDDDDGTAPIAPKADAGKTTEERLAVLEHEYGEMGQKLDAMRQMLEGLTAAQMPTGDEELDDGADDVDTDGDMDVPDDPAPADTDPDERVIPDDAAKAMLDEAMEICPTLKRPRYGNGPKGAFTDGMMKDVKRAALICGHVKTYTEGHALGGVALDKAFNDALMAKRASVTPKAKAKNFGDSGCGSNADLNKRFADFWNKQGDR